jgi:Kelch motif/Galactose oxidase, central domain
MIKSAALRAVIVLLSIAAAVTQANAFVRWMPAPAWTQIQTAKSPPKRAAMAMAYDPVSQKVVVFGGYTSNGYLNDMWTFDGTSWVKERTSSSPSPRAAGNMAFDAHAKKLVLFGGFDGKHYLGDTWLWDGATSQWTAAQPTQSPTAVTGPAVFTDPRDRRADVFGGFDGHAYHAETWRWMGSTWRRLQTQVEPYGRSGMVFAANPKMKSVVVFAGLGSQNPDNTWTWDGRQWLQASPSLQPPPVYYGAAAYDAALNSILEFGGGNGGVDLNETWSWNGMTWTQLQPATAPSARESVGMAYDAAIQKIVLFGGTFYSGGVLFNDTWEFTP